MNETIKARLMLAVAHEYLEDSLMQQKMSQKRAHEKVVELGFGAELLKLADINLQNKIRENWQKAEVANIICKELRAEIEYHRKINK